MSGVQNISAKSHLEAGKVTLNWEISNFHLICPNPAQYTIPTNEMQEFFNRYENQLVSPTFDLALESFAEGAVQNKFKAKMYASLKFTAASSANHDNQSKENHLSAYVCPKEVQKISNDVSVFFTIAIIGKRNEILRKLSCKFNNSSLKALKGWGWPNFLKVKKMWDQGFLVDNAIKIRVDMECTGNLVTRLSQPYPDLDSQSDSLARASELSVDFERLLESGQDSDVKAFVEGRTFPLHSWILKARCPVFRRMFDAQMLEAVTKTIEITDAGQLEFEHFLKYLYGGRTTSLKVANDNVVMAVAGLADKYEVDSLKEYCFKLLVNRLSLDNVGEISIAAYRQNASREIREHLALFCSQNWSALSTNTEFRNSVQNVPGAFLTNNN